MPWAVAEKPIAQPVRVFGTGRIDPEAETGHSRVGDDEPAGRRRLTGADEAVGELWFSSCGGSLSARYSPGTHPVLKSQAQEGELQRTDTVSIRP
jgi:hypothetical protein